MSEPMAGQSGDCPAESLPPGYEAPCIETVLSPDELEREVLFAGGVGSDRN